MHNDFGIFVLRQAEALKKMNVDVGVLYSNTYSIKRVLKERRFITGLKKSTKRGFPEWIYYILKTQIRTIDRWLQFQGGKRLFKKYIKVYGKPDVVHLHVYEAGKIALWIKKHYGIPYIVTEHFTGFARGLVQNRELEFASQVYKESHSNIAVSENFCNLLTNMTHNQFLTIPNSVNCESFALKSIQKPIYQFVSIGFLDKKKNFELQIKAMKYLKERGVQATLIIMGDGVLKGELTKLIVDEGVDDIVNLNGRAEREDIINILSESDCFLSSSLIETFGIVVIEAMSAGLPSIVTRSGGPESIIKENFLGIISGFEVELYAEDMIRIMNSNWNHKKIRDYAISHYSEEVVLKKQIELYNKVLRS